MIGNDWKIIKEAWEPKNETSRAKKSNDLKNLVSSQFLNWVDAWGNQNINLYMSFYSKEFMGKKRSRSEWEAYRHHALQTNSNMSIQVSNIQLHQNEETIEINFTQRFKSDRFSDVGIKELVWKKMGSGWKIHKETWIPS
jgi:murein L,D-transpeptidase YafK